MLRYKVVSLFVVLLGFGIIHGYNRSLFFRTSAFWDEPRFVRPWLTTLDIQLLGGSTHRGRDCRGKKTNLTSIYGSEDVAALSEASPGMPLELKGDPEKICFRSIADMFEADFNFYQNFRGGLFLQFHLPAIVVRICPSGFVEDEECVKRPKKRYLSAWERSLQTLDPFLRQFNISTRRTDRPGLSDSTLFVGWSYTYEDTVYLDFVDTTIKTGVLFPTGRKKDLQELFDVAYGYDGHYGIPLHWDITIGAYECISFGFHSEALFLRDRTRCVRMKTKNEAPTGLIVLGKGKADIKPGIVWKLGAYFKADHFFYGLSLLLGFSYEQKNRDTVNPCDTETFNRAQVNNDPHFKKWARSIAHLQAEYDFAHEDSRVGARVAIFYNHEMTGLRTFNIGTAGGYLGIDVSWCF